MMSRRKGQKKRWQMARICHLLRRITHTTSIYERNERWIQIPIHFVENETVEMGSTNDGTTLIARIPNEILEKILSEALLSSSFSWPNHVCRMYNNLCQVNVRFRDITHRLVSMLPSIYLSNGGEPGIVSVSAVVVLLGWRYGE